MKGDSSIQASTTELNKRFPTHDDFTLKLSTYNIINLSKFLAEITSRFKTNYVSPIYKSKETGLFYAYIHIPNNEVAFKLQEITPFPEGTIQ